MQGQATYGGSTGKPVSAIAPDQRPSLLRARKGHPQSHLPYQDLNESQAVEVDEGNPCIATNVGNLTDNSHV